MKNAFLHKLKRHMPLLGFFFFGLAVWMVHHEIRHYRITHVLDLILAVHWTVIAQAAAFSACSYLAVTCYDRLALRYIGRQLPVRQTMLAAFVGFTVSHNAGHSLLSGIAMRLRFYCGWGLSVGDVVRITLFDSVTYGLGLINLLVLFYLLSQIGVTDPLDSDIFHAASLACMALYAAYGFAVIRRFPPITIRGLRLHLPTPSLAARQIIVSSLDIVFSAMVLYSLLSVTMDIPLLEFLTMYTASLILGTLSQVPGGLGVFEGVFLHLLSGSFPGADILASLIMFRIIHYFFPLALAGILLLYHETRGPWRWRFWQYRLQKQHPL
jgi:phosphatidylglycerol lysyltransferase